MHIGLDGLPLTEPKTGVGHYTFELATALARADASSNFELVYPSTYPPLELDSNDSANSLPANLGLQRVAVGPLARHWWSIGLPRYVRQNNLDVFHGTNYDIPLWRRGATVLTVHDLSVLLYPETHLQRSVRRARRRLPTMVKLADAIITPTESVRREVCEHLGAAAERVFAVPEAARASFRPIDFEQTQDLRRRLNIGNEFLLTVGTVEPRKNLSVLLRAFEQIIRDQPQSELQLVIAGGRGWLADSLFEGINTSPARDRIVLTDYLHDEELRALYSSCRVFVYPSLYEGFGLPPLEAMACGAPVIASRIAAIEETTGSSALLFDPNDPAELAQRILELLANEDKRRELSSAGQRRASEFSWEKAASATLEVYAQALNWKQNRTK